MKLNKKFYPNNVYRTKKNELVVFIGYQDGKLGEKFGFFRHLNVRNSFFGMKLSEIDFEYLTD